MNEKGDAFDSSREELYHQNLSSECLCQRIQNDTKGAPRTLFNNYGGPVLRQLFTAFRC